MPPVPPTRSRRAASPSACLPPLPWPTSWRPGRERPGPRRWTAGAGRTCPWFDDHVAFDRVTHKLWTGEPITADDPISWALGADAAHERPDFLPVLGPFLGMLSGPASIDPLREEVRSMIGRGGQPRVYAAPSRADLVSAIRAEPAPV